MRALGLGMAWLCAWTWSAWAGPDWIEKDDAGSFVRTAQRVLGTGELRSIQGTLGESLTTPDLVDMYLIRVLNPTRFRFDTTAADFDTQLFILAVTEGKGGLEGYGLLGNDDAIVNQQRVIGSLIDGPANDGSGARIDEPGIYALAICGRGRMPTASGKEIYHLADPTEISGPDGPGGNWAHDGWEGPGPVGRYRILVEGVGYVDVPSPGTMAGLGLAAWRGLGRRRRGTRADGAGWA
jgi:hypothetical protein